MYNVKVV